MKKTVKIIGKIVTGYALVNLGAGVAIKSLSSIIKNLSPRGAKEIHSGLDRISKNPDYNCFQRWTAETIRDFLSM